MTKPTPEIIEMLRAIARASIDERLAQRGDGSDRSELSPKAAAR
jgi:hypothetical protein